MSHAYRGTSLADRNNLPFNNEYRVEDAIAEKFEDAETLSSSEKLELEIILGAAEVSPNVEAARAK